MLYSERQQGHKNISTFEITKVLIGKLFEKYLKIRDDMDYPYSSGYNSEELEFYFLKTTKKSRLNPQYFTVTVANNTDLFDIIECAIHFLYEEYASDPDSRRYPHMRDSAKYSKFINETRRVLEDYSYTIRQGIIETLPDDGMSALLEEKIQTNEPQRFEEKIEEAKRQFFDRNGSLETRKSACAKLSDVIDYIRPELSGTELNTDADKLMNVINNTDVRHSKKSTRMLQEGNSDDSHFVEWVFYSLLNCINFYLKTRK